MAYLPGRPSTKCFRPGSQKRPTGWQVPIEPLNTIAKKLLKKNVRTPQTAFSVKWFGYLWSHPVAPFVLRACFGWHGADKSAESDGLLFSHAIKRSCRWFSHACIWTDKWILVMCTCVAYWGNGKTLRPIHLSAMLMVYVWIFRFLGKLNTTASPYPCGYAYYRLRTTDTKYMLLVYGANGMISKHILFDGKDDAGR